MNKATILVSAVLGIFLGTSIGIAQASDAPVSTPVEVPAAHVEVTNNPILLEEVTIIGKRPALHAVKRGHAKVLVCTGFRDLEQGFGQVKTCEWK